MNEESTGPIVRAVAAKVTALTRTPPGWAGGLIVGLIALGWLVIYLSGGTRVVPAHWFYIPILLAAIRFGVRWAVGTALVCAVVAGPMLPTDAAQGVASSMSGNIFRAFYFVFMGVLMAAIVVHREDARSKEFELAQHEVEVAKREAELAAHQAAMVSTVSHEFRSPLSVLLATSRMLSEVEWSGFEATVVEGITSSARRLNDLVTAVLAVSEGPLAAEQDVGEVRLREVISGVRSDLDYPARQRVEIDVAGDVVLRTSPAILQGLLRQLLDNALKFSPGHSMVEIEVWGSRRDHLFIGVSDRGSGIADAFLPRAFEPFTQQDESMTRSVGGLGIGLFVANRLAQCLEAEVELRPRSGGGTEAVLILPGDVLAPFPREDLFDLNEEIATSTSQQA